MESSDFSMDMVSHGKSHELSCIWSSFSYLVNSFFCLIKEQEELRAIHSSRKCWDPSWSCVKHVQMMMIFWHQSQTSLMITSEMFISSLMYSSSVAFYHIRIQKSIVPIWLSEGWISLHRLRRQILIVGIDRISTQAHRAIRQGAVTYPPWPMWPRSLTGHTTLGTI